MESLISLASKLEDKHKLQQVYRALVNGDRLVAVSHLSYMAAVEMKQHDDMLRYIVLIIIMASIIITKYLLILIVIPTLYILRRKTTHVNTITKIMEEIPNMDISEARLNALKKVLY